MNLDAKNIVQLIIEEGFCSDECGNSWPEANDKAISIYQSQMQRWFSLGSNYGIEAVLDFLVDEIEIPDDVLTKAKNFINNETKEFRNA